MTYTKVILPAGLILLCYTCSDPANHSGNSAPVTQNDLHTVNMPVSDPLNTDAVASCNIQALSAAYVKNITQIFTVSGSKKSVIKGRKGFQVTVVPAQLENTDGSAINGNITVSVVELTNSNELYKANAATVSNGRLLISGGSYYVNMNCNGNPLRIKKGQGLTVQIPKLKENEMELFYGQRDGNGNMNWEVAKQPLIITNQYRYKSLHLPYPDWERWPQFISKYRMYESLSTKVSFSNRLITLQQMVEELQKKGVDKVIDTVDIPWRSQYYDLRYTGLQYDTLMVRRYRILSLRQQQIEKDSVAFYKKNWITQQQANQKYLTDWQQHYYDSSIEGQLQKYYQPSVVTQLGWINCDRFYNNPQPIEVPISIPYTFKSQDMQYFLIYKSFNGLMSGLISKNDKGEFVLSRLPKGQAVTFIAFTKQNNKIYQCKKDFVIEAGKKIEPEFTELTAVELQKIFGSNVKI